ncbi:hypothetical protein SKTS_02880 [Sulfurimicrobium lacus]|uniref:DUF6701 domain-containing protein n=1 Tax=Sulfurimicrobium lacus TaxID=2715678 RepID=A0A6F8V8V5_9PROT|nr:hypothetical protein SKTS_02880 [Sulfurimicrobium lacus]
MALIWSGQASAATQTMSPTTCSNVTGTGSLAWGSPGNALANDTSYATVSLNDSQVSNYLQCTGYGFTIPAGATINGVTVNVERMATNSGIQDAAMRLVRAGTIQSTDRSTTTAYPTTSAYEAHGGAADLWGGSWTVADINNANFGAAMAAAKPGSTGGARTASVDHIEITVTYTPPAAPFSCTPPPNTPAGLSLTCVCDTFGRASLNPSTIFGANWIVSTSDSTGILPSIVNSGYLRLTNNTGNNAKAATVPGIFPAAGNYISVEFQQYAYNGSGADGIAVTLSDYSVPAVPGAYGGSLGYAQKTGIVGFAGGWIGVALDEYGNYQNPTEGRIGGPGFRVDSVGMRGSGSGMLGYNWLGGTATLNPQIDNNTSSTPSLGYYYQVVVDARNEPASTAVAVNRDTGAGYASLISIPNVYAAATAQGFTQAPVPSNWQISFTGSTGGSTNIHEIGSLRICASTIWPPSGGTASGFNAIDEAYGNASVSPRVPVQNYLNGHIYMKVVGTPFKLNVAALANNQIQTAYVVSGSKSVTVKLVDNSDGACVLDSTQPNYCSAACTSKTAVTGGSQTLTFTSAYLGQQQSGDFTLNTAYKNLAAIISDGTVTACSTDAFSVRPLGITPVTSANATNAGTSGLPIFKAGSDSFSLTATTTGIAGNPSGYTGVLKVNNSTIQAISPATVAGTVAGTFPAATPGTPSSVATGNFTYSEVGAFLLPGYNPATDVTSPRGVFDGVATASECATPVTPAQCDAFRAATWTGVDSVSSKGDCILDSYRNTRDTSGSFSTNPNYGKFGCSFGLTTTTAGFGRFVPDHFSLISAQTRQRSDIASAYAMTRETTGTVVAGMSQLTVADMTDFVVGDAVVVFGAGTGGKDLLASVTAAAGNLLTLSTPASIGVTAAPVFKRLGFTYMDEPLQLVLALEARNAAGGKTQNYATSTGLAKLDNSSLTGTANNSWGLSGVVNNLYGLAGCRALFSGVTTAYSSGCAALPASVPTAPYAASAARVSPSNTGAVIWTAGATSLATNVTLKRASKPDGAFNFTNGTFALGIWPKDGDGITLLSANDGSSLQGAAKSLDVDAAAGADVVAVGVADMRFGRMRFSNAYGSELLDLSLPMEVQYWNWNSNGGAFARNTLDSSTFLVNTAAAATNFSLSNYRRGLAAGETSLLPAAIVTFSQGAASMRLARPGAGNSGSVKVCADLDAAAGSGDTTCAAAGAVANLPYLQGGAGFNVDPSADATFGTFKSGPVIYLREGY